MYNFDFKSGEKLSELLSTEAEGIAKKIEEEGWITTTQYRRFYDWILRLEERAEGLPDQTFKREILPMVKFMKSKVKYAETRRVASREFTKLMFASIDKVNSQEELRNFKLFMEAILGFLPRK